mgnify:CR=1 FL=1
MAGNTKNLGQVAGVYIGNTPPENTILIWLITRQAKNVIRYMMLQKNMGYS